MEALTRLKSIQATLQLMQEYSLCSYDQSSDRFVADFLLFLTQSCGEAEDLSNRCATLLQLLPKISMSFLRALLVGASPPSNVAKEDYRVESPTFNGNKPIREVDIPPSLTAAQGPEDLTNWTPTISTPEDDYQMPTSTDEDCLMTSPSVSLKAMEKARSTLEDFCRSYFMFHEMDVRNPRHVFENLPLLYFVEAFIYQLDEDNEEKIHLSISVVESRAPESSRRRRAVDEPRVSSASIIERNRGNAAYMWSGFDEEGKEASDSGPNDLNLEVDPFRALRDVLNSKGLMTERIESELKDGVQYWKLERKLCESMKVGAKMMKEDVFKAITLKSFDYRVLNHLMYSLRHQTVVEAHVEFLAVAELLVEIADDLFDYEDDVLKNSFNILRMLIYACGPSEAPTVLATFINAEEVKYQQLLAKLEPSLTTRFQERCEEAVKEGGGVSKSGSLGSWTIPSLIVDEDAFRAQASCEYAPVITEV